jgi:hypothetical protein
METGLYFALNKHYLQALSIFEFLSLAIILASSCLGASLAMSIHRQIDGPLQRSAGELFS